VPFDEPAGEMSFTDFLSLGFGLLPQTVVSFPSGNVSGVWNVASYQDAKAFGGYEQDSESVFTCKTSLVPSPKALIGQTVTRNGETWRIARARTGDVFTHFSLIDPDKA
jgi:hypothetical protein